MQKKLNYILTLLLILVNLSCKYEKKNNASDSETEFQLKTDSVNAYNELANTQNRKIHTISEYNSDNPEIENIKRPDKTIIRNLAIDTSQAFGIWAQDLKGNADFWLTAKSFYVADYDGNGEMPYILDKDEITIYYNDFIQKGIITSTKNDTLKIKWSNIEVETVYLKFKN